jgi:ATP-dependent RNA helicase SUPV3L1/SUV3
VADAAAPAEGDATAVPAVAAEPELVEVWRPGGRSEERRPPRHDRNRHHRNTNAPQGAAQSAPAEGAVADGAQRERHDRNGNDRGGQGRRDRNNNNEFRRPRSDAPAAAVSAEGAPNRDNRGNRGNRDNNKPGDAGRPPRERERFQGKGKGPFKGGDKGREGRGNDRGGATRPFATSAAPRERDRPIDPNSPFAKLAALKEQLSGRKD